MESTSHPMLVCDACGARVSTLRRGRCSVCYLRWAETRPVGMGASCMACGERRRENLRSVEFQNRWLPMCHNCATRAFHMQPVPRTIEGLRERLTRDRRWHERRCGRSDRRVFWSERRVGERRASLPATMGESVGECVDATEFVVEIYDAPLGGDVTRIADVNCR